MNSCSSAHLIFDNGTPKHIMGKKPLQQMLLGMKKNEILSFASKWTEMENIILSEVNQAQMVKTRMFSLICGL
jgi:hypothetical protein